MAVHRVFSCVPIRADGVSDDGQHRGPRQAAGRRVKAESRCGHFGYARGQRDECSDPWQQPRPEHDRCPTSIEPVLGFFDFTSSSPR